MMSTMPTATTTPYGVDGYIRLAGAVIRTGLLDPTWLESRHGQWWVEVTGLDGGRLKRMAQQFGMERKYEGYTADPY